MRGAARIAGLAAVGALVVSAGSAASASPHGALSFSGTCRLSGHVSFKPGLSNRAQTIRQRVRAPGTCSGTFVDRHGSSHQVDAAPVSYAATERAERSSCAGGTDTGRGALVSPYGTLAFHVSETRAGAAVVATATGVKGGSASGTAAPSTHADPTALTRCAGAGIRRVAIDIALATTPSISG